MRMSEVFDWPYSKDHETVLLIFRTSPFYLQTERFHELDLRNENQAETNTGID